MRARPAGQNRRGKGITGRKPRVAVLAAAALAVAAGCGQSSHTGDEPEATETVTAPAGHAQQLRLPQAFPDQFPDPPDMAVMHSTVVEEHALLGQDLATEHGTVVSASVLYRHGRGETSEVESVLEHYRQVLPAAGWTITADEPPAPGPDRRLDQPGHRLRVEGHGRSQVTITVTAQDSATELRLTATDIARGRAPSQHEPSIALPGWYQGLPEPPVALRRYQIRITASVQQPRPTYHFAYEQDPDRGGMDSEQAAGAAVLARHYLRVLPEAGWAVAEAEEEQTGRSDGVLETTNLKVDFTGYGLTGQLHTSHTTSAAGQWMGARASITIHPTTARGPAGGPK